MAKVTRNEVTKVTVTIELDEKVAKKLCAVLGNSYGFNEGADLYDELLAALYPPTNERPYSQPDVWWKGTANTKDDQFLVLLPNGSSTDEIWEG